MYKRDIETEFLELIKGYPIVTVIGPRQSGKTTLVKNLFPQKKYINLEEIDTRNLAIGDPRKFLEQLPNGAILDEIQRAPQLLSYIQVIVDNLEKKGMFILTGSHQLELQEAVSQSLAGRTAILHLLPMSFHELLNAGFDLSLNEWMLKGGYPRIYKDQLDPTRAYRGYFQTYVERDVRQILQIKDLLQFERFIKLTASRVGQLVNYASLASDVGVSAVTIKEWIAVLEATYILIRLEPYFENFGKRLIKSF